MRVDIFNFIVDFCDSNLFDSETLRDQLVSLWTTYCLIFGYDVDTNDYEKRLKIVWSHVSEEEPDNPCWSDYASFHDYMSKYIV